MPGGAPKKAPGGLNAVLYVRVERSLIEALDALRDEWSKERGVTYSRGDVVRAILRERVQLAP